MLTGYFILKEELDNYRGVDRVHFEPTFLDELVNKSVNKFKYIWELYSGWRQELYKKIEENSIALEASYLIKDENVAKYVINNIPKSEGSYELVKVMIFELTEQIIELDQNLSLGYDIAYLGGDFYSAIKDGLIVNPITKLEKKYSRYLNKFGLFINKHELADYVKGFKSEATSESNSEFHVYLLSSVSKSV